MINFKETINWKIREIIKSSVLDAISEIDQKFGGNWSNWKWGDAHSLTHKHLFYKNKFINWLFDLSVGPYRSGGSNKTPNAGNRKTYTISLWVKRSVLGSNPIFTAYESPYTSNSGEILLHFDGDDTLHFRQWNGSAPYIILMITQRNMTLSIEEKRF